MAFVSFWSLSVLFGFLSFLFFRFVSFRSFCPVPFRFVSFRLLTCMSAHAGCSSDLSGATRLAHSMVSRWGMSDKVGFVAYNTSPGAGGSGAGKVSQQHLALVDSEVKAILDVCA